jgi:glycerol-3-phosphate dehydrogenase
VAEKVVDRAVDDLSFKIKCTTGEIPIVGSATVEELDRVATVLADGGMDAAAAAHLTGRYGAESLELQSLADHLGLDGRLLPDLRYLQVEAHWAIEREGALDLDDVLARRLRAAWEDGRHGAGAAELVARMLAPVRGWDDEGRAAAVRQYLERAAVEYGSGLVQAAPAA